MDNKKREKTIYVFNEFQWHAEKRYHVFGVNQIGSAVREWQISGG